MVKIVVIEGQCGCSVLTFICTRQVGAAIPLMLFLHRLASQNLVRRLKES